MLAVIRCGTFYLLGKYPNKNKDLGIQKYNFALVLYGSEAWTLKIREERKLKVFENMVLRRIFGPRRDEITRE